MVVVLEVDWICDLRSSKHQKHYISTSDSRRRIGPSLDLMTRSHAVQKHLENPGPELTLKVDLVSGVRAAADHHAGRVNHDLPAAPQPGPDLPRASALLQLQGEQVVLTTQPDQDPLPDVHPLAGEPQGVGAVAEVGPNREVTLHNLREKKTSADQNITFPTCLQ